MHAMAKAIKVVQTIVVNQGKANVQLTLELKVTKKDKGRGLVEKLQEAAKAIKTQMVKPFMGKGIKATKVR